MEDVIMQNNPVEPPAVDASAPSSWTDYSQATPPVVGIYEWRVPSKACAGLIVRSYARFRKRGAGYSDTLSPEFDHWDGYRVTVPAGTQWRDAPPQIVLKPYEQQLICAEGVEFDPCPFCRLRPRLSGYTAGPSGGVVVTSDAHAINSWRIACCRWAGRPEHSDPRLMAAERRAALVGDGDAKLSSSADHAGATSAPILDLPPTPGGVG